MPVTRRTSNAERTLRMFANAALASGSYAVARSIERKALDLFNNALDRAGATDVIMSEFYMCESHYSLAVT